MKTNYNIQTKKDKTKLTIILGMVVFSFFFSQFVFAVTSEIIPITKAEHLNREGVFIKDIYTQVKERDDIWTSLTNGQYVRATFSQILDNTKDNTIYARPTNLNQPATIEVYPVYTDKEGNTTEGSLVATFPSIDHEGIYKVLLTNLQVPTGVFDIKISGNVDMDYIIDPTCSATGGAIFQSGGYCIHEFDSAGSFVVPSGSTLSSRVLIVGGGGGGSVSSGGGGGGGGGGGVIQLNPISLSAGTYAITVGGGGSNYGGNGGNTTFGSYTAIGGGGGGASTGCPGGSGVSGGSGGGGGGICPIGYGGSGGSGTSGQGNSGGDTYHSSGGSPNEASGGGGGASGAGQAGTANNGGDGGNGIIDDILGFSAAYGAGGGGSAYTQGGGGAGGSGGYGGNGGDRCLDGTTPQNYIGAGGGGGESNGYCDGNHVAGSGGSGIVAIRYLIDTTAPGISANNNSSTWYPSQRTATISATDTGGSALAEVRYNWGSNAMNGACTSGGTITNHGASLNAPTGGTTLYLCVRDGAGNTATWSGIYRWENTAPSCGTWAPTSSPWKTSGTQAFTLSGSSDTGGSGISTAGGNCTTGSTNGSTCTVGISDIAGNTTTCTSPVNNVDSAIPSLSANNSDSAWYTSQRTATISASDTGGSTLAEVRYNFGSNPMNAACTTGGTVTTNGVSLNAPTGGTTLYLCARDGAGNTSTWNGTYNWEYAVATTTWSVSPVTVTVLASDSGGSTLAEVRYSISDNAMNIECTTGGTVTTNGAVLTPSKNIPLYLCARDVAGNAGTWNGVYDWESTHPSCGTWAPTSSPWKTSGTQAFTLSGSSDTGGSGINVAGGNCTTGSTNGSTCTVGISDIAGNTTTCTSPVNNVESTAPSISANNNSSTWFNYQRTASVSASDSVSLAEVRYNFGSNPMDAACTTGGTVTTDGSILNSPAGGTTLYLCARDGAGNAATWSGTYNWEDTASAVSANNSSDTWYSSQRTATVSASDTGGSTLAEVRYNFGDNTMNGACTSGGTVTTNGAVLSASANGTILYLCARDGAGNTSTWSGPYKWENTVPSISANNSSVTWYFSQRTATVSTSDTGGSGVAEIRYNFGSNPMNAACTTGGTVTTNGAVLSAPANGTTLYLCVRDGAGNTSTWNGTYNWWGVLPYVSFGGSNLYISPADNSSSAAWGCSGDEVGVGAQSSINGSGNTTAIVGACSTTGIAAKICSDLDYGGYTDWYLPAREQLYAIYNQKDTVNTGSYAAQWVGFSSGGYWSSTEDSGTISISFGDYSRDITVGYYGDISGN